MPDTVVLDVKLPGMNGLEIFRIIHTLEPKVPIIMMTAYDSNETGIETIKMGAFDYILKPFEIPDMLQVIDQALEAERFMRSSVCMDAPPEEAVGDAIIGYSEPMKALYKTIRTISPSNRTVLIRGESGTGKILTARAIYQHSLRADKPVVVINCRGVDEDFLGKEMFGYERNAFRGAAHCRVGKIEQAHRGTLIINAIGEMPASIQARFLDLLGKKCIQRIGGQEPIVIDVRIIAATDRDLEPSFEKGFCHEDLYADPKAGTIVLPPLRERARDIPPLTDYFLICHAAKLGIANSGITKGARKMLEEHSWPDNVRELRNTLYRAMAFSRGAPISPEDIKQAFSLEKGARRPSG